MTDRQFKGIWIPAHIWEQLDLTAAERCFGRRLTAYQCKQRVLQNNEQAAEELGISQRSVTRAFAKLENLGAITIEKRFSKGSKSTPWRDVLDTVASSPSHDGEESSPQWRGIKNKEKNKLKNNENTLLMPFEGKEFEALWKTWCDDARHTPKAVTPLCATARPKQARQVVAWRHGASTSNYRSINYKCLERLHPIRQERNAQRAQLDRDAALKWSSQ